MVMMNERRSLRRVGVPGEPDYEESANAGLRDAVGKRSLRRSPTQTSELPAKPAFNPLRMGVQVAMQPEVPLNPQTPQQALDASPQGQTEQAVAQAKIVNANVQNQLTRSKNADTSAMIGRMQDVAQAQEQGIPIEQQQRNRALQRSGAAGLVPRQRGLYPSQTQGGAGIGPVLPKDQAESLLNNTEKYAVTPFTGVGGPQNRTAEQQKALGDARTASTAAGQQMATDQTSAVRESERQYGEMRRRHEMNANRRELLRTARIAARKGDTATAGQLVQKASQMVSEPSGMERAAIEGRQDQQLAAQRQQEIALAQAKARPAAEMTELDKAKIDEIRNRMTDVDKSALAVLGNAYEAAVNAAATATDKVAAKAQVDAALAKINKFLQDRGVQMPADEPTAFQQIWRRALAPMITPPAAQPSVQQSSGAVLQPPPEAIQMLRSNPNLRAQFDAKYGAGSAAKILGS